MSNRDLVYSTNPADVVQIARRSGMTDEQIIRAITIGKSYPTVREIAAVYASLLGITEAVFVRVARARQSLA